MSKRTAVLTKEGKKYVLFLLENGKVSKDITIQSEEDEIADFKLKNRLGLPMAKATYSMVAKGSVLLPKASTDESEGYKVTESEFDTANDGNKTSEKSPSLKVPEVKHWQRITPCARLGESFLREQGLKEYADAASACLRDDESQTLGIIKELVELQDEKDGKGIGCFATIVASSGTGKTQLAATASIDGDVRSLATVLYINASPGGSQDFYRPHETLGLALLLALKSFKEYIGSVYSASATTIHNYWSNVLKENNLFCGFLHYLLFGSYASINGTTSLEDIHRTILDQDQRFLFFMDEVPSRDQDNLGVVLFFRDLLRSIGISPILMSTHTGAENYVEKVSREGDIHWVKVFTQLPLFKQQDKLHDSHAAVFEETERPLVSGLAAHYFNDGKDLSEVVTRIRRKIQTVKVQAWTKSPSLQLMQLFATKFQFGEGTYKNVHHMVGEHFGSLVLEESTFLTPNAAKSFKQNAKMSVVSGEFEPLLYLALVSWDNSCLNQPTKSQEQMNCLFPLTMHGNAISVVKAFKESQALFEPWFSIKNDQVNQSDGNLLEVLAHASLTLASLKTDCFPGVFLGGVPLNTALCIVAKLMSGEDFDFDGNVEHARYQILKDLKCEGLTVPALGGSNSVLSPRLNQVPGTNIGWLERPPNSECNDGFIRKADGTFDIMVECKNRRDGLNSTELTKILQRIPHDAKCCLIFTTKFDGDLYSDTTRTAFEKLMKNMPNQSFRNHGVSVIQWDTKTDVPEFFQYSCKGEGTLDPWKAEDETTLLVVVFLVDLVEVVSSVEINGRPVKRLKTGSRGDLKALIRDRKQGSTINQDEM